MGAPPTARDNPLTRSAAGLIGMAFLAAMLIACLASLPWTMAAREGGTPRYKAGDPKEGLIAPAWWRPTAATGQGRLEIVRLNRLVDADQAKAIAARHGMGMEAALDSVEGPAARDLRERWPAPALGTDLLGRDLLVRCLAGGGVSLGIGLAAALLSVFIGTFYGAIAAYAGGATDAVMMRIVDILYGLPYVLLVVLLAVASDAVMDEYISRAHERTRWIAGEAAEELVRRGMPSPTPAEAAALLAAEPELRASLEEEGFRRLPPRKVGESRRMLYDIGTLLVAIGGVSWLTMARVVRGQVLSLKARPFMEAARALGVPWSRQFTRHLLPNLVGPIIVYATLTVPQAILQESFLSFLGIGVEPPLPSWGNLAAEGLGELNTYKSHWWLLLFPCVLLGSTLLALNFVGEGLREAFDPRRARR